MPQPNGVTLEGWEGQMNIAQYATGLQHVGIPTQDMEGAIRFYTGLGFSLVYETTNGDSRVVFLRLRDLVIEVWEGPATGKTGAIDHIAIDVTDIEAVFATIREAGLIAMEGEIRQLPFWERGVRYFTIAGPNAEKVEFIQKL